MKKITKNSAFKTPEGYFESLPDKLLSKISSDEASFSKLNKGEHGFKVPSDYFENLTKEVLLKLDKKKPKVVSIYRKYSYYAASIAAIMVVLLAIKLNTVKTPTFDNLLGSDIENYFETHELDFNDNELAELLPIHNLEINDIVTEGINEERIVEYLDNNIEDFQEFNTVYDEK